MGTAGEPLCFLGLPAVIVSPAMRRVMEIVEKVARTSAAVLIVGETGSGKEIVARAIYYFSLRSHKPWVDVNCAALPEHLMESELFGHERGAFSGADSTKPGLFEMAHTGTLFLDEIGELEPRMQVKLSAFWMAFPITVSAGRKRFRSIRGSWRRLTRIWRLQCGPDSFAAISTTGCINLKCVFRRCGNAGKISYRWLNTS